MSYTPEDRESVRQAIMALVNGERVASVTIRGRTTQYSSVSLPDLRALAVEMSIGADIGIPRPIRIVPKGDRR